MISQTTKQRRSSAGRFADHVATLAKMIAERHDISSRRAKKLIGQSLGDPRVIQFLFEHINRQITGRGDGLTLVDLAENKDIHRYLAKDKQRSKSSGKSRTRK